MKYDMLGYVGCVILAALLGCTTSTVIPIGPKRPATDPDRIRILLKEPRHFESIAIIEAESAAGLTYQQAQDYALQELKTEAAQLGANGIILQLAGKETGGMVGGIVGNLFYAAPADTMKAKGIAVWIIEE